MFSFGFRLHHACALWWSPHSPLGNCLLLWLTLQGGVRTISLKGSAAVAGGGGADESLLFFTPTTRAFFALIAVLSASALPFVFLLLVFARRKFVAQQQVLPT
jgi:hypothetical protein